MIKHLFKLIWNKKKQNFLLMAEMLVSFIVMFAVFTLLVFYYQNYNRPMGFVYDDVWVVNYTRPEGVIKADSLQQFYETLRKSMRSMPQVKSISFTNSNVPFSMSSHSSMLKSEMRQEVADIHFTEPEYAAALTLPILEGRWFNASDVASKLTPVLINAALKEKMFGKENVVGKELMLENNKVKVIGVASDYKDKGDFHSVDPAVFKLLDTTDYVFTNAILLKTAPGADAAFEGRLYKLLAGAFKNANVEIEHLDKKRVTKNNITLIPMIVLLVVAGFLIINVALGLFGVLWYNINKRKAEIGLRRAVGASAASISSQLVGEALVLATISLLVGSFFAIQFPLLHVFNLQAGVYIVAQLLAILFIYVLVIICALYPGKQAAAIYPAIALHEE